MKLTIKLLGPALSLLLLGAATACEDNHSYSDYLNDEEKATNWFMAQQTICLDVPEDSVSFETGSDAPFYKMDEDGFIYMQVISKGDMDNRPKKGDMVYFRFMRKNLQRMYKGEDVQWEGNSSVGSALGSTNFIFDDMLVTSSSTYGQGIQIPLKYFGYNAEVNLVLRSYYGFTTDQSECLAYIYNIRYFKPEY